MPLHDQWECGLQFLWEVFHDGVHKGFGLRERVCLYFEQRLCCGRDSSMFADVGFVLLIRKGLPKCWAA